jgi:hypothetical protein
MRSWVAALRVVGLVVFPMLPSCSEPPAASDAGLTSEGGLGSARDGMVWANTDAAVLGDGARPQPRGPLDNCPADIGLCPEQSSWGWTTLLRASSFSAGAKFTALGRGAVLLQHVDATWEVVRLRVGFSEVEEPIDRWAFPAGAWLAKDVIEGSYTGDTVYALACTAEPARCVLLRGRVGTPTLELVSGSEEGLRDLHDPVGLTHNSTLGDTDEPCVYGSVLRCKRRGAWITLVQPEADDRIQIADLSLWGAAVVSARGRVWDQERDAQTGEVIFREVATRVPGLVSALSSDDELALLVADGRLLRMSADGMLTQCPAPEVVAAYAISSPYEVVVTKDGRLLQYRPPDSQLAASRWCTSQTLAIDQPIIAAGSSACGISHNPRFLTADALIGSNFCALD